MINPINSNFFNGLPVDVFPLVLSGLNIQSLLRFESVCHGHASLTEHIWSHKRNEEKFLFNWSFLEGHSQIHKWSYILPSLLVDHIGNLNNLCENNSIIVNALFKSGDELLAFQKDNKNIKAEAIKNIHKRYDYLIEKFPLWGCYIEEDLNELQVSSSSQVSNFLPMQNSISPLTDLVEKIAECKQKLAEKAAEGKWGGDLLLQGLFEAKRLSWTSTIEAIQSVFTHFKKAIDNQATLASHFALNIKCHVESKLQLATAAAHQKDYFAREAMQLLHFSQGLPNEVLLKSKEEWTQSLKNDNADCFSDLYRKLVPANLSCEFVKYKQDGQAEVENNVNSLAKAARANYILHQFETADLLYAHALKLSKDKPFWLLSRAALVKIKLRQFEEAFLLYTQISEKFQDKTPPGELLASIAYVKLRLKQWKEADGFYTRALESFQDKVPVSVLVETAQVKFKLEQFKEAHALYTRALEKFGDQAPVSLLAEAEECKKKTI